ncbi:hypothetical protein Patl_0838 [Paraglaciecola sp. T6c]|uniref:hypothetical protein n=1 Tax=Pseudoalteromonas atlantica (strain T6c / ATCC BAA-1087) TaxID=3042615 RepID=UPI00005C73FA|nr:hypothetical protein [Paraglaciecola sp. T6c]ABG39366.1 hypothetical protein Patl_0838 [Paraglaciecola sp. T6c]
MNKKLKRLGLLSILLLPTVTQASILPLGTTADATVAFDDVSSFILDTQQTDRFSIGAQSSQMNDGVVTGDNPVSAVLNDPIFINSSLGAQNTDVDFEYVRYFFDVNLSNSSADSTAEFVFDYRIFQQVSASASDPFVDDAFADSTITLFNDNNLAFLFSSVSSDINMGAQTVTDSGTFSFLLDPGESLSFGGFYESNVYSFGEAAFSSLTNAELVLTTVNETTNNVSEPTGFALTFIFASLAMGYRRQGKRNGIAK